MAKLSARTQRLTALHESLARALSAFLKDGAHADLAGMIADLQEHASICNTIRALNKVSGIAGVEGNAQALHRLLTAEIVPVIDQKLQNPGTSNRQTNLLEMVELLNALATWEARSESGFEIQRFRQRLADRIFTDMQRQTTAFIQRLDKADYAEMPLAGALILQLDANIWLLEGFGQRQKMDELQAASARLARSIGRSVSRTIQGFLAEGDMVRHFDVSAVLLYVEDLAVAMLRVLESTREEEAKGAAHPFILSLGEQIVSANMADLEALLSYYLRALERGIHTSKISADTFRIFATHAGMTLRLLRGLGRQGPHPQASRLFQEGMQRIYGLQAQIRGKPGSIVERHVADKLALLEAITADFDKPLVQIIPSDTDPL
jgi:hypothetical protein